MRNHRGFIFGDRRIAFLFKPIIAISHFAIVLLFNLKTGTERSRDHCDRDSHPLYHNVQIAPLLRSHGVEPKNRFAVTRTDRRLVEPRVIQRT